MQTPTVSRRVTSGEANAGSQAGRSGEGELQVAQKPRIGGAENAAATSAFATFEFATVSADQMPNAVAATIAKPMISSLRIGLSLHPV